MSKAVKFFGFQEKLNHRLPLVIDFNFEDIEEIILFVTLSTQISGFLTLGYALLFIEKRKTSFLVTWNSYLS